MRGIGIALDSNFDLKIVPVRGSDGKIIRGVVLENTLPQNQAVILTCQPGEIKQMPSLGIGISDMLLDNDWLAWRRKIMLQMQLDGQTVNSISLTNGQLKIDADYD